mgnify:CR=1 FL=1|tara:strand:- start:7029 stop:8189 length:1161 start_codon:yes stop_codon:yes gene_type:complete
MNKYFIFASDERSYLDLKNIVLELKNRNLPYFFLYSREPQRISPAHNIDKFNYDSNIEPTSKKNRYNTLGFDLHFTPDYLIISNEVWDPEKMIAYEFKTKGAFIVGIETSSYITADVKSKLEILSRKSFPSNTIDIFFDPSNWGLQTKLLSGWYKNKSVVVGNPKYDDLKPKIKNTTKNIILIHGLKDKYYQNLLMEKINNDIIPKFKNYKIYYKPHPYEIVDLPEYFEEGYIKNTKIKLISNHEEYLSILENSKYVISYFTSLLFFPLIYDRKIIILLRDIEKIDISSFSKHFNKKDYDFWKNILKFNSYEEFKNIIGKNYINSINKRNNQINKDLNKYLISYKDINDLDNQACNNTPILKYFNEFKDQKSSSRIVDFLESNLVY